MPKNAAPVTATGLPPSSRSILLALKAKATATRALAESLGNLRGGRPSSTRARAIAAASGAADDVMAELRREIAATRRPQIPR